MIAPLQQRLLERRPAQRNHYFAFVILIKYNRPSLQAGHDWILAPLTVGSDQLSDELYARLLTTGSRRPVTASLAAWRTPVGKSPRSALATTGGPADCALALPLAGAPLLAADTRSRHTGGAPVSGRHQHRSDRTGARDGGY